LETETAHLFLHCRIFQQSLIRGNIPSQMIHLEFFTRAGEIRKRVFQKVGQLRHSKQIGSSTIVVRPRRLGPQRLPVPDIAVTAAEPGQRAGASSGIVLHLQTSLPFTTGHLGLAAPAGGGVGGRAAA